MSTKGNGIILHVFPSYPGIHISLTGGRRRVQIFLWMKVARLDGTTRSAVKSHSYGTLCCRSLRQQGQHVCQKKPWIKRILFFFNSRWYRLQHITKEKACVYITLLSQQLKHDYRLMSTMTYLCLFKGHHGAGIDRKNAMFSKGKNI